MTASVLTGYVIVPLFGVLICLAPLTTRPTVRFGVRVPPEHATDAVILRQRRDYQWRTALVAICATAVVIAVNSRSSGWPSRVILLGEIAVDFGCYWLARRRIAKVKADESWFAGRRQTVVADTSWRTDPQPFPVGWLLPAVAVIAATVVIGVLRYPQLDPRPSAVSAFGVVGAQVYVTGVWAALLLLVHRARPDIDTADPAASLRGYRKALGAFARGALILLAGLDASLLLHGLQLWQVAVLPGGTVLVVLPFVLALVAFLGIAVRAGWERARTASRTGGADRDDDRFWKAGLVYVNRDDPAVLVSARFAFGWTVNLGNRTGWLLVAGFLAVPAGLVIIRFATGS